MRANRLLFIAGACAVIALGGCGSKSSVRVKQTSSSTPVPAEKSTTVVVVADSGPAGAPAPAPAHTGAAHVPDHAPAHGLRRKHVYRYHPDLEIYHCAQQGLYFWLEGDKWAFGASLPASYGAFSFDDTVQITLATDKPYTQHKYVAKAHPAAYAHAGKGKGKGKEKGQPAFTGVETDR